MKSSGPIRGKLKQLPGLRSTYYLGIVLQQMVRDQWKKPSSFDDVFTESHDPWRSTTSESEKERFTVTLDTLAYAGSRFATAVELGCAEGIFTERLAPMCDTLLALDYSEVALGRARERLAGYPNVELRRWDMRKDRLDGQFHLVVAMGVITSLYRPRDVRRICDSVAGAVRPGGFLLFSDVRQSPVFETAWWGPMMLRGGEQIRRHLTRNPSLELLRVADTASHVFAAYRRRD
jgi:2-polyprenyl-3-methyl-5-hydroxy-6-metoxy-1,4-benzoquinol methylase